MDPENKRRLAARLIELKQLGFLPRGPAPGEHAAAREHLERMRALVNERQSELMLELYAQHYTGEQLQAELDFYRSEMGRSLVDTQSEIKRRFQERLPELIRGLDGKLGPMERSRCVQGTVQRREAGMRAGLEPVEEERAARGIRFSVKRNGAEAARAYLYVMQNDLHDRPFGLMEDVFVDESERGEGLGTMLVRRIVAAAREAGCYKLIATSRDSRPKVHELYL